MTANTDTPPTGTLFTFDEAVARSYADQYAAIALDGKPVRLENFQYDDETPADGIAELISELLSAGAITPPDGTGLTAYVVGSGLLLALRPAISEDETEAETDLDGTETDRFQVCSYLLYPDNFDLDPDDPLTGGDLAATVAARTAAQANLLQPLLNAAAAAHLH